MADASEITFPDNRDNRMARLWHYLPGLMATGALAALAILAQRWIGVPYLSPMVLAMVAGIVLRNAFGFASVLVPGVSLSVRKILRAGIVLMGFQLTLGQLEGIGLNGVLIVVVVLAATFIFTKAMARVLGVERKLGELIAAGTSVCGASAVIAVNTVTGGEDEDVAYAIACVTVFGTLSMLIMPVMGGFLAMAPESYGLWVGATVHEMAQVMGAAFTHGDAAGQAGTIAKLSRVLMLAPLILALGALAQQDEGVSGGRAPMPWFVFGFIAVVVLNSLVDVPPMASQALAHVTAFFLTMALAGMGLETHVARLRQKGVRPLMLGAVAWVFVSVLGLTLVLLA
ncbi:YeiH family protein [Celeribacter persicus]|uniref:Putative integral membrane protein (TIGR00698 family) n=1 Tax=Celeribacter persicus TaxID=1651082 RepID=A0A2T5HT16_9RHOB|nr:YeiH family protein [Celeribacter persicus]PTQ74732.1 putative integral membrane protein (TIGR00698 family) [Celeribacter persicus]